MLQKYCKEEWTYLARDDDTLLKQEQGTIWTNGNGVACTNNRGEIEKKQYVDTMYVSWSNL